MRIDSIRIANHADAAEVATLVNEAYRPESAVHGWTHESHLISGNRTTAGQVAEVISNENSAVLLGLGASEIIACVHVERDGEHCHIGMLAVKPTLQGSGIGKEMLAQAESFACQHFGSTKFNMLVVSARTELISFYLRRGYQQTGALVDYPLSAGFGIPRHADIKLEVLEKRAV